MVETNQSQQPRTMTSTAYRSASTRPSEPTNLADLLERVLDKGVVIAGDVQLYLGSVELLTLKIRLVIASVDKAQEIGINWWESDPALSSRMNELTQERDELRDRLERLEARLGDQDSSTAESQ